jgi:hypothetical protein
MTKKLTHSQKVQKKWKKLWDKLEKTNKSKNFTSVPYEFNKIKYINEK